MLDYLDTYYQIIDDEFYFKQNTIKCNGKKVIESITNIFMLNMDTVEFILRGWAFNNGMTSYGWDSSVNHIWFNIEVTNLPDQDCIDAYMMAMRQAMGIPSEFIDGHLDHPSPPIWNEVHNRQAEGRLVRGGEIGNNYYMGVDTADSNSSGSIFIVNRTKI